MTAQILTASRLREGDVVYFTAAGQWSEWLSDATVADAEAESLLARGKRSEAAGDVIDAYLVVVDVVGGRPAPLSQRERIRARGPTVRADLGKQARRRLVPAAAE